MAGVLVPTLASSDVDHTTAPDDAFQRFFQVHEWLGAMSCGLVLFVAQSVLCSTCKLYDLTH